MLAAYNIDLRFEFVAPMDKVSGKTITFVATSVAGEKAEVIYLGDFWSAYAFSAVAASITIT